MFRSASRKLWGIWVLALLLLLPCLPAKAATAIVYCVVENSSYVNLRSQPTQSSTRLGYYQPGVWVEITGENDAIGHWALQDDLYDAVNGGEFVGRAHYDNKYIKKDGRWFCTEMSLTYLRGEANIKKRYSDSANAYKVFMM